MAFKPVAEGAAAAVLPEQAARWEAVRAVSRRFNAADRYVFSVHVELQRAVPARALHRCGDPAGRELDLVSGRGLRDDLVAQEGAPGLRQRQRPRRRRRPVSDFQRPYLRRWLRFIGIGDVREIVVAPTLADRAAVAETRARARAEAAGLAASF